MKYLSNYTEDKQSNLFERTGTFFAFAMDTFHENKKEGVKYVNLGAGMICPKENVDALINGLETIQKEGIADDLADNGKEGIIERELGNHECYYTGSIEDAVMVLEQYGFTRSDVQKVYNQEIENHI